MLDQERSIDEKKLPLETLAQSVFTWLSEDFFGFRDAKSAVPGYCDEVPSPHASNSVADATFHTTNSMWTAKRMGILQI